MLREGNLYLYRPGEVTDINKEGDVGIVVEVKLFIGEGIFTLFDIRPGDDGNFLTCLCASCKACCPSDIQVKVL